MAPSPLRRRLSGLALAGSLALLPSAAGALPLFDPDRKAAIHEKAGAFLTWLGEIFTPLWEASDTGKLIDPDGAPKPNDNSDGDTGMMIDPDG